MYSTSPRLLSAATIIYFSAQLRLSWLDRYAIDFQN